jgi:signal transduction histidine kinase
MTLKKAAALALAVLVLGLGAVLFVFHKTDDIKLNPVDVNDIAQSLAEQWSSLDGENLPGLSYDIDYVVLDSNGKLVAATRSGLNETLSSAIANRDTIVDISRGGKTFGKLILYNKTETEQEMYRVRLLWISVGAILLLALFVLIYSIVLDRTIFLPFRRLREFAGRVAEGNFDIPLKMDKGNLFGAFTESFDLMRHELARARESERKANQSKKELVASLSHDIKTPVASIKAVSEIMMVKTNDEDERRQLQIIDAKADQINALITNLFSATLEELQNLKVNVSRQKSKILAEMIRTADYNNCVVISAIPECEIVADPLRLQQVIDNIVSNSYKYAGTSILVSFTIKDEFLEAEFRDYGPGVKPDELPLLMRKYYRAGNANGKSGGGLGLYISKYLMNRMSGGLECRNTEDGFAVTIKLNITNSKKDLRIG